MLASRLEVTALQWLSGRRAANPSRRRCDQSAFAAERRVRRTGADRRAGLLLPPRLLKRLLPRGVRLGI
jgi:hypothetical protein